MKKWTLAVASMLILSLAGSAFAQKPPKAPRHVPDEQEMEEPDEGQMAPRPGMPPRGPMGPGMEERNPAVEKEAMDYLKKQVPGIEEDIEKMQQDKPEAFHKMFRGYMFAYHKPELRDKVISKIKSDFQVRRLVRAVRQAKGAEKDKFKVDLEKALSEQFDNNLERMEFKLKKMQEGIADLKTRIDKRRSLKSDIVKKRLGELTGETETWDW
ncbi:MAG: hypothetical protein HY926_10055 [Elusimicrobia bacterium]|nr:hypothetical protein [Elusimicrobiota bacterium]